MTRFVAQKGSRTGRYALLPGVVLLRHYIGAIAPLIIGHCERVNGMSAALQRNLPGIQGESYEQAIATN